MAEAPERSERTDADRRKWASHNASPQICWHTLETESFISPLACPLTRPFTDEDQQSSLDTDGQLKHVYPAVTIMYMLKLVSVPVCHLKSSARLSSTDFETLFSFKGCTQMAVTNHHIHFSPGSQLTKQAPRGSTGTHSDFWATHPSASGFLCTRYCSSFVIRKWPDRLQQNNRLWILSERRCARCSCFLSVRLTLKAKSNFSLATTTIELWLWLACPSQKAQNICLDRRSSAREKGKSWLV